MKQKVMRVGNSLGVVVPASFVQSVGARAGDNVRVSPREDKGEIVYRFSGTKQLSLGLKKSPKK